MFRIRFEDDELSHTRINFLRVRGTKWDFVALEKHSTRFDSFEEAVQWIRPARRKIETNARLMIEEFMNADGHVYWIKCNHQPIDVIVNDLAELKIGN